MKSFLVIASLFLLASCNDGSDGNYQMRTATGAITKQWTAYAGGGDLTVESIDLSNPGSIQVNNVKYIKRTPQPGVGNNINITVHTGNCVLSGTGPTMVSDYAGYYDTTLVSGDATTCSRFVPTLGFQHYADNNDDFDKLILASNALK